MSGSDHHGAIFGQLRLSAPVNMKSKDVETMHIVSTLQFHVSPIISAVSIIGRGAAGLLSKLLAKGAVFIGFSPKPPNGRGLRQGS